LCLNPQKWLLIEAINAHSDSDKRIPDQIAVINIFPDPTQAIFEIEVKSIMFRRSRKRIRAVAGVLSIRCSDSVHGNRFNDNKLPRYYGFSGCFLNPQNLFFLYHQR